MQKYGIIGWPVEHSLSPKMQQAAFDELRIEATYDLLPVEPSNLENKVEELKTAGYSGWNVTVPHKSAILPFLDVIDPAAAAGESVNTVVNRGGELHGFSTDGYGLEMAVKEAFNLEIEGNRFLFWGTGGAAQAATTHFALRDAAAITLVNRTHNKAVSLKMRLEQLSSGCEISALQRSESERLKECLTSVDVVIQCTSIGLRPDDSISMPLDLLPRHTKIVDMIYNETELLRQAKAFGHDAVNGSRMLLHQGAKAFRLWTEKDAPVEVMQNALKAVSS